MMSTPMLNTIRRQVVMRCFILLFVILLLAIPTFSGSGKIAKLDNETGTISYQEIDIPDEFIRSMESRDTIYEQLPATAVRT